MSETAQKIVDGILLNLQDRGGFDSTFDACSADTLDEMFAELMDLTQRELIRYKLDLKG